MNTSSYGKGVVVPEGRFLVHPSDTIRVGDYFLADPLGDWLEVEQTAGLKISETPFVGIARIKPEEKQA